MAIIASPMCLHRQRLNLQVQDMYVGYNNNLEVDDDDTQLTTSKQFLTSLLVFSKWLKRASHIDLLIISSNTSNRDPQNIKSNLFIYK